MNAEWHGNNKTDNAPKDLELKKKIENYGKKLKTVEDEGYEDGIGTLAVYANQDTLDSKFVGGVVVTFKGSTENWLSLLYQLVKAVYIDLCKKNDKGFADFLFDDFLFQLKRGDNVYDMEPDGLLERIIARLTKKQHADIPDHDDDENDDD